MLFQFIEKVISKFNYRPISLLPITGKFLERLLFDRMFFTGNNLISDNQFGFRPYNSYINQLFFCHPKKLWIFDDNLEVRNIVLDMFKPFGKVRHKILLYKLKQNVISGNILNIIDFLSFRKQRAVLGGSVLKQGFLKGPDSKHYYLWIIQWPFWWSVDKF